MPQLGYATADPLDFALRTELLPALTDRPIPNEQAVCPLCLTSTAALASPRAESSGTSQGERCLHLAYRNMVFHCIRPPFHDTTALQYGWYPSNLPSKCDCSNNFTMEQHSHVPSDVFPPSGTMKFTISWPTSSQKYVMKCAFNRTCSQLCRTNHLEQLPTHRTGRDWTSRQTECGVGDLRRCTGLQPPRPLQQESDTFLLYRKHERGSIRTEDTRSGAFVLHSTCFFGHRRNGERGNLLLQTSGFDAHSDVGSSMQVPSDLPYLLSHPIPMRSKIFSRSCCPLPSSNRPHYH